MAVTTTCTKVTVVAGGSISVEWDHSDGRQFDSLADLQAAVAAVDTGTDGRDLARLLMLARWLRADPDISDNASILNRTCTLNMGASPFVQIG